MSKLDAVRAMREARYAQMQSGKPATSAPAKKKPAAAKPATPPKATADADAGTAPADEALCGHRNMSGRTCTRERGHSAKSHRYS